MFLDKEFQVLTNIVENLNADILDKLKTLEIEKKNLRLELGSRKNAILHEENDYSIVWGTMSLLTSHASAKPLQLSKGDQVSHRVFETWARSQTNSTGVSFKVLERQLGNARKVDQMEMEMIDTKADDAYMSNKLQILESESLKMLYQ